MNDNEIFDMNSFEDMEDDLDDDMDTVVMTDENGVETVFTIIDGVENNGITYLLVVDDAQDEENAEALILKEIYEENGEAIYEHVEDEQEFNMAAELFRNSSDDYDITTSEV